MRTIVLGTGGVGGYFGGLMARAGQNVGFVARGPHLQALRSHGLQVRSARSGDFHVEVRAAEDPAELGEADLVLFCVKSYDTVSAARTLLPVIRPETAVISLQNGVDNEEAIDAVLGSGHVMGGVAYVESTITEPGAVAQMSGPCRLAFGELNGDRSERARIIDDEFRSAGIDAVWADDIMQTLWLKFMFISAMAGLTTLTGQSIGPIVQCAESAAVLQSVIEEVAAVGRAAGVNLPDTSIEQTFQMAVSAPVTMKSSMQRDMERGRAIEVDALNGAVVRLGARYGVATPVNSTIYGCIKLMAAQR
ncbi:MAG TPA: 2-dehydropantoate 2-reductase [Chloroflexota bacterium]|nr:2-dehydropantoate 2-reductase [Chloroflexota bacterium]